MSLKCWAKPCALMFPGPGAAWPKKGGLLWPEFLLQVLWEGSASAWGEGLFSFLTQGP